MVVISNQSMLSIFSIIRNAIIANSTLSAKFNTTNIYQFEPKHKAVNFVGFPYFWINIPSTDEEKVVFDNNFTETELSIPIILRMDWEARDNVLSYCNAFLKAIRDYESIFKSSGYYDVMVELIDVNSNQTIQQKQIVESEFIITVHGQVLR